MRGEPGGGYERSVGSARATPDVVLGDEYIFDRKHSKSRCECIG